MKGTLVYSPNKQNWIVEYKEENGRDVFLEVEPGRIDELKMVGTILNDLDTVDFKITNVNHFPYRFAVPIVIKSEDGIVIEPKKKVAKKQKITLWLSEFYENEVEIICDDYDCSANRYWYFFDRNNGERRIIIGCYPVDRTIIHKVEQIEIEI